MKFSAHTLISSQDISSWCPFLSTSLAIYHSKHGSDHIKGHIPLIASISDKVVIHHLFELRNSGTVDVPKSNTTLSWIHIFEWYVVRRGSKNQHQKDKCSKEIGLHASKTLIVLGSIFNMIVGGRGGVGAFYDHLMSMKFFSLIINKIST